MFGVPYQRPCTGGKEVDESALMEEHRFVYASTFAPDKFCRYVRIPLRSKWDAGRESILAAVTEKRGTDHENFGL